MLFYLRFEEDSRSNVKLAHPFHPMETDHMHETLHHVEGQHHCNSGVKEDEAS
jgi:hypothetical protein